MCARSLSGPVGRIRVEIRIYMYIHVHVLMRDEKEVRKKQAGDLANFLNAIHNPEYQNPCFMSFCVSV